MEETSDGKSNLPVAFDRDVSISRYYIYILFGFTANLKARLKEHARGKVTATKFRRPLKLIYYEYHTNQKDAKARERFLKSGFGRSQLKLALKDTLQELGYQFK